MRIKTIYGNLNNDYFEDTNVIKLENMVNKALEELEEAGNTIIDIKILDTVIKDYPKQSYDNQILRTYTILYK